MTLDLPALRAMLQVLYKPERVPREQSSPSFAQLCPIQGWKLAFLKPSKSIMLNHLHVQDHHSRYNRHSQTT